MGNPTPDKMFMDNPPEQPKEKVDLSPKVYEPVEQPIDAHVDSPVGNVVDLPSKGLLGYPASITHREIMAGDEEILKSSTNKNFSRTVNKVLKSICNNAEFFDDMYVGDRDYVMIHIWANTYDSEKEFEVKCRHCQHKDDMKIDIFKLGSIDPKDNMPSRLPMRVSKTGDTIKLRLVTVRDDNNAEEYMAKNPNAEVSTETLHYALAIEFGRPMSIAERVQYVQENITAKELATIREFHRHFSFGLDTSFEHTCSECQGVTRGNIPFLPEDIIAPEVRTDLEQLLRSQ